MLGELGVLRRVRWWGEPGPLQKGYDEVDNNDGELAHAGGTAGAAGTGRSEI